MPSVRSPRPALLRDRGPAVDRRDRHGYRCAGDHRRHRGDRRVHDLLRRHAAGDPGFASLGDIGVEALTGFFAAFINVRIAAPVTAGIALAATIGAGATAQLGAMRISEEIDALEVMAINSMSYLVSTRA